MAASGQVAIEFPRLGSLHVQTDGAGKKAAPLDALLKAGFPVPSGFVIPAELVLHEDVTSSLGAAVEAIGGFPVAARSSGHLEDLPGASFAGQYVTRLEIGSVDALSEAIEQCRASASSPQILSYLERNHLERAQARVSVLVQCMVDVEIAGVAFSLHPTTGREEHALIECCKGLGERLVSGQTAPTRYVVDLEQAAVVEREAGEDDVQLSHSNIALLRRYVLELQAYFGRPQDIEWAIDRAGKLWILQSRPITRVQWRTDIEEFTTADFREGGVSARVCTPLMYSLYRDALQGSMQDYFVNIRLLPKSAPLRTWIAMYYGRPYWSATAVKRALFKVPGFDEEIFDRDLGIQKSYGEHGPVKVPTNLKTILPAIPVAIALEKNYKRQLQLTEKYGERFLPEEARYLKLAGEFGDLTDADFTRHLKGLLEFQRTTESDYFTTIYNNSNYQSDFKKLVNRIGRASEIEISAVALMAGLQDVSHMSMQRDLLKLVAAAKRHEGEKAQSEFLKKNYFHGDVELDISVPRWGEQPARVQQMVSDIIRSGIEPKDPDATASAQFRVFSRERRRVLVILGRSVCRRLRFKRAFVKRLNTARLYLSRREQMREYSTRAYNLVRRYVLEAGERLKRKGAIAAPDDVFMLHTDELMAVCEGEAEHCRTRDKIALRRLLYRGYREFEPPGEIGGTVKQPGHQHDATGDSDNPMLKGIGCSAGEVTGTVRIVAELSGADAIRPGEVLVTRFTDPGWTPVLGLVTGIVTEVGGLLSHAAIIGREYGIPAVLNVPKATQILHTGQKVRVDGTAGTVTVLDEQ